MRANSLSNQKPFSPVRPDVQFARQEEEILRHWDEARIFEKSLELTEGASTFNFYDGPPFATGLPHYGHILAGVLKDIVPRYWTMKGFHVTRRFGWDCHGLPVEHEINKTHGLESRKQILEMGVGNYNAACRGIVQRYSNEWKKTVRRVGRWVDMENGYFTMDVSFMQSVWWVFRQLWEKGLIYEGHKVVPYSVGLSTPLSNFEANLNYKQVQDPAITVSFPLEDEPETAILAWTTTPWTLPSNLGLAVGRTLDYVKVRESESGRQFILAAALFPSVFKEGTAEILETFPGEKLLGRNYQPLFPFFADRAEKGAFRVIHSDHVTTDSGTGVVHMAPAFGEEDYYACLREGIELVNPVDDDGTFTAEVAPWAGRKVKEADKEIIAELKQSGRLFKQDTIVHSYPFCWRTETPLIYRAVSSWFVAVEKIKDRIVAANQTTRWVPEHLRDGRFGNWLENARDWAISRNRFWGTPLPIWRNAEGEMICIGSREELEKLSGESIEDLHIDRIDRVEIPSPTGRSPLKRVEGVLDCWFESGSMPYAQWGYPHAHPEAIEKHFPADFIAEGLDQTRGWFYTLMVIGAALFDRAPFKNVIVNGLILAEDGKKMSKSLRNYPDPMEVLEKHGADALRLYLIDSPVVKAQELRFSEAGVRDVARKVLVRWWNSYSFFVTYANLDDFKPQGDARNSPNVLDQWVLSRLHGLIEATNREMAAYRLYNVVPALLSFIEDLTNTYIRFNRPHFVQDGMPEDKRFAFETLYEVLRTLSLVMAPFAPFLAETIYRNLAPVHPAGAKESVHLERFPEADTGLLRPELEEAVGAMVALVTLGRNQREKVGVRAKIPLRSLKIVQREERVLENLRRFERYVRDELNVQSVEYDRREDEYVQITAKANFPVLGPKLGARMKIVAGGIARLGLAEILRLEHGETIVIEGEPITAADVEIRRAPRGDRPNLAVHQVVSIELDPTVTPEQEREGLAREVIRNVQAARKSADFHLDDRIRIELACEGTLREAVEAHREMIAAETSALQVELNAEPAGDFATAVEIDGLQLRLAVARAAR